MVCSGDCSTSYSYPTVVCPSLSLTNGVISYSDPTLGLDSIATHSCDTGYALNGGSTRTCESYGTWSGSFSTCEGEQIQTDENVGHKLHSTHFSRNHLL